MFSWLAATWFPSTKKVTGESFYFSQKEEGFTQGENLVLGLHTAFN